jgi:hypothetical protein
VCRISRSQVAGFVLFVAFVFFVIKFSLSTTGMIEKMGRRNRATRAIIFFFKKDALSA